MKIIIDASPAVNDSTGIGRYGANLIQTLPKVDSKNHYLYFYNYIRDKNGQKARFIKTINYPNVVSKKVLLPGKLKEAIWGQKFFDPLERLAGDYDVFHGLNFLSVTKKARNVIVTIHDLTFLLYPHFITAGYPEYFAIFTKRALQQAKKVITISSATATDINKFFPGYGEKIKIIPLGVEERFFMPAKVSEKTHVRVKYQLPDKFILFLGTLEPRKNIENLIQAYYKLSASLKDKYRLIIAGKKGWLYEQIFQKVGDLNLEGNVLFLDYVDDKDLPILYQLASLFAYPSFYEGFGLPVLEAMASGVPVLCSNTSSFPELVGEAALMVEPISFYPIKKGLERILKSKVLQAKFGKAGKERALQFSWGKTARETLKVYKEVNSENNKSQPSA